MAWCLPAPSHYLKQCWLSINEAFSWGYFHTYCYRWHCAKCLKIAYLRILLYPAGTNELIPVCPDYHWRCCSTESDVGCLAVRHPCKQPDPVNGQHYCLWMVLVVARANGWVQGRPITALLLTWLYHHTWHLYEAVMLLLRTSILVASKYILRHMQSGSSIRSLCLLQEDYKSIGTWNYQIGALK